MSMRSSEARLQSEILAITILAALAMAALCVAPRLFVLFDEAYNLNLIKTLAEEGLYASHLEEGYRLFDPAVTTGPTLVLPLALALRLGGSTITTVRAAMLVIFLICMIIAYLSAREILGGLSAVLFLVLFATTALVLVSGLCVLGDIPSISLGLATLGLLNRSGKAHSAYLHCLVAAGICLGLAILAKDMMALLLPALLITWCHEAFTNTGSSRRHLVLYFVPLVVAAAIMVLWRVGQVVALSAWSTPNNVQAWMQSAVATTRYLWTTVVFNPLSHQASFIRQTTDYFGPMLLSFVLGLTGLAVLRWRFNIRVDLIDQASPGQQVAATGFAMWMLWYFVFSGPHAIHRHLLPGIVLGELLIVYLVQKLWHTRHLFAPRLLATALVLVLVWAVGHGIGCTHLYLRISVPRLEMQSAAAAWVRANVSTHDALSGWGWFVPWHIAFLSDRLPAQAHTETKELKGLSNWFVLSPEIVWSNCMDDRLRDFLARQGPPVFEQRLYPIYRVTWRPTTNE